MKLIRYIALSALLFVASAFAADAPRAIQKLNGNVTENFNSNKTHNFLPGANVTFGANTTLSINGTLNLNPTTGTWNLGNVTIIGLPGGGDATTAGTLDQFANVTQAPGKSLAITGNTTLGEGSVSGANTGDQNIILSGAISGSGTGNIATTMSNTTVAPATYGSGTHVGQFIVGPDGRLTFAGNVAITAAGNVINNGTLTNDYLVLGNGTSSVKPSGIQVTGGNNLVLGNISANAVSIGNVTGATSDFELPWIGDNATGRFFKGNITTGANMTRTKVGNNIVLDSIAGGGGSVPNGMSLLMETANLGTISSDFFISGNFGTAPDVLGNYTVVVKALGTVGTPTASPLPGAVPAGTVVAFSSPTPSLTNFRATTNGTDPSYTIGTAGGNFTVVSNGTVKVVGNKQGWFTSPVASFSYTIDPIPTLSSAALQASGTDIVIGWPENVSYGAGGSGGYAVTLSGGAATVTGVSGNGTNSHTLTVNRTVTNAETGTLAYTQPGNGAEDSALQDVATFSAFTINMSGGPAGGGGGPALVAEVGAGAASGGNTFSTGEVTTTGANLITVIKGWYGATEPDLTDSKTNTYTAAGAAQPDSGSNRWVRHYHVYGGTVGANHSWTLTGSGHYGVLTVLAFSGMASSPVDQNSGDVGTSWTTLASGSLTPSQANSVSVTAVMFDSGSGAITHPTGYTAGPEVMTASGAHIGLSVAWKTLTATTTINPDWTTDSAYLYGATKHVNYKY